MHAADAEEGGGHTSTSVKVNPISLSLSLIHLSLLTRSFTADRMR